MFFLIPSSFHLLTGYDADANPTLLVKLVQQLQRDLVAQRANAMQRHADMAALLHAKQCELESANAALRALGSTVGVATTALAAPTSASAHHTTHRGTIADAALVDPLVNAAFARVHAELEVANAQLTAARDDLSAANFTPDAPLGRQLVARVRRLLAENAALTQRVWGTHVDRQRADARAALNAQLATELAAAVQGAIATRWFQCSANCESSAFCTINL